MIRERGAADAESDTCSFSLKFYTEKSKWDLVGNNTPVFFRQDPQVPGPQSCGEAPHPAFYSDSKIKSLKINKYLRQNQQAFGRDDTNSRIKQFIHDFRKITK